MKEENVSKIISRAFLLFSSFIFVVLSIVALIEFLNIFSLIIVFDTFVCFVTTFIMFFIKSNKAKNVVFACFSGLFAVIVLISLIRLFVMAGYSYYSYSLTYSLVVDVIALISYQISLFVQYSMANDLSTAKRVIDVENKEENTQEKVILKEIEEMKAQIHLQELEEEYIELKNTLLKRQNKKESSTSKTKKS